MSIRRILVLNANVFIAALKEDEEFSDECANIIHAIPRSFVLAEPSIVYQEVCGTLARRVGLDLADKARSILDKFIEPALLFNCDKSFCLSASSLCHIYGIYSIDALYLKVALNTNGILVSLDKEDFIERVKEANPHIEFYHVSEFPYL